MMDRLPRWVMQFEMFGSVVLRWLSVLEKSGVEVAVLSFPESATMCLCIVCAQ